MNAERTNPAPTAHGHSPDPQPESAPRDDYGVPEGDSTTMTTPDAPRRSLSSLMLEEYDSRMLAEQDLQNRPVRNTFPRRRPVPAAATHRPARNKSRQDD